MPAEGCIHKSILVPRLCLTFYRRLYNVQCTSITTAAWLFVAQGTFGALGHGDEENRDAPVLVNPLWAAGIVMVS